MVVHLCFCSMVGSWNGWVDSPAAACFACMSTSSLLGMLLCADIHLRLWRGHCHVLSFIPCMILSVADLMYWLVLDESVFAVLMMLWLSE